ncbi:uncharacterized protein N7477_005048 [Penicillium maclennaniae]|uniref:uncharacterized protein n=1 Tax=Penicillium maclennaniae TaxID=1343394 RepID=UPI00253F7BE5|nr:uncharacterized protein N7477_005048 [Penicillium maclennaniae]KAJ5675114.1 hypothetical protein N7477_005048 [Penicillium maclennaniae]
MAAEMKTARRAPAKFIKPDWDPAALKTAETPSPLPLLGVGAVVSGDRVVDAVMDKRGVWLVGCVVIARVEIGLVRVTVVGVAAQCVQTVTVVDQPSGIVADVTAAPVAGTVTLAVASGHQVVVSVVVRVIVVKPVGQISVYDVTMTVVVTSPDAVGVAVTTGVALEYTLELDGITEGIAEVDVEGVAEVTEDGTCDTVARLKELEGAFELETLDGAALNEATLEGITLDGATLEGAKLEGITLEGATLDEATLEGITLDGATLEGAKLEGITLDEATLEGITLDGATLEGAKLEGITLEGAMLDGATLEGITLDGILLEGAMLEGIALDGTTLEGTAELEGIPEGV